MPFVCVQTKEDSPLHSRIKENTRGSNAGFRTQSSFVLLLCQLASDYRNSFHFHKLVSLLHSMGNLDHISQTHPEATQNLSSQSCLAVLSEKRSQPAERWPGTRTLTSVWFHKAWPRTHHAGTLIHAHTAVFAASRSSLAKFKIHRQPELCGVHIQEENIFLSKTKLRCCWALRNKALLPTIAKWQSLYHSLSFKLREINDNVVKTS